MKPAPGILTVVPVEQISGKSENKTKPEVGQNEDGEGNGDEGDAVPDNLHHSGEVEDEELPLHISIWKWENK